jgi:hypothetical protein
MIVTHDVPPGTPPAQAATITTNVDFPTYLKAVEEALKAKNPKVQALRIRKPAQPPEFAADARGFVVAILRDIQIDLPAPDPSSRAGQIVGADAQGLRMILPEAETALSYQIVSDAPGSHLVHAKVEEFTPSTTSQVLAIKDDEAKPTRLNRFAGALVISAMAARLRSQPINADLDNLNLRGFAIQSISPLVPSGWVRLNLVKTSDAPLPVNPIPPPITPDVPATEPVPATATTPTAAQPTRPVSTQAAVATAPQ